MNLTELQIELRSMEENLLKLRAEIEKMKPKTKTGDEAAETFRKVERLGKRYPIKRKWLKKEDMTTRKDYIIGLSYLTSGNKNILSERFLYLCRLAGGIGIVDSAEDIYRWGMDIDKNKFEEICSILKKNRYFFLTDAMILMNIEGTAEKEELAAVRDTAEILGCGKEELYILSHVAKAVLTDNFIPLSQIQIDETEGMEWMRRMGDFVPESWLATQRTLCKKICMKDVLRKTIFGIFFKPLEEKNTGLDEEYRLCIQVKSGTFTKKDTVLIEYEKDPDYETQKVEAPKNGIVYYIENGKNEENEENKYLEIFMTSYFDNYTDFYEWYKRNKQRGNLW